ncbi:hypothetical protein ACQB6R_03860 [Propionibacteriaceae bacterium G1746]|uniref:hypothetical protein n=1 Tax=Aestuariimicrobium sp. G57 TaxID=3418485 RepID=UPI003C16AB85
MVTRDSREALEALADPELAAAFTAAAAQHRRELVTAWLVQLQRVQTRLTPLRSITKFSDGVARLQFADHSALLVNADHPSRRLRELALALARDKAVTVADAHDDGQHVLVRLHWADHHLDVEVVGADQIS